MISRRGPITLLPVPDHVIGENRRHRFVVGCAPRIEVAILFDQLERITVPIFPPRLHDIDMGQQQDCFGLRIGAVQDRHQIAALWMTGWNDNVDVTRRETGGFQTRRHGIGRLRAITDGLGRIDLHQLLVERAKAGEISVPVLPDGGNRQTATTAVIHGRYFIDPLQGPLRSLALPVSGNQFNRLAGATSS